MNSRLHARWYGWGLFAVVLSSWAVPPARSTPAPPAGDRLELPDTPAGRRAAAFVEAFNSGDDVRMSEFEKQYRAKSALEKRTLADRLQLFHELRERWGTLTPLRVVDAAEHEITVLVRVTAEDGAFELRFEPEGGPPYGLVAIQIMGPVDPVGAGESAQPLDDQLRNDTIASVAQALKDGYVYPKVGEKMAEALARYQSEGRYNATTSASDLAHRLTTDLRAICNDLHLAVRPAAARAGCAPTPRPHGSGEAKRGNYGFRKVETLPGNIGYIKLDMFDGSKEAQDVAAAALAKVAKCAALVFDLRENPGGSPDMIQFISSYLFDEPTHLNSFYDRLSNKTSETWTLKDIPGQRFAADVPVYILTSSFTGSAAEEFAYNLKNLKRATLVGQVTGGAAHPVSVQQINVRFEILVPYARAENPITKTNWEGVGVVPDIQVPASEALDTACKDAARKIEARSAAPKA